MEEKDFLPFCRYYHGEKECPYNDNDQNESMLWFYERVWVNLSIGKKEGAFDNMLDEYMAYGLGEFEMRDSIPTTLKALLFNRYAKGCYSIADAVEPFKVFYEKYY